MWLTSICHNKYSLMPSNLLWFDGIFYVSIKNRTFNFLPKKEKICKKLLQLLRRCAILILPRNQIFFCCTSMCFSTWQKYMLFFTYLYDRLCELRGSIELVFFVRGAVAVPRIFYKICAGRKCFERIIFRNFSRGAASGFLVFVGGLSAVSRHGLLCQNGN